MFYEQHLKVTTPVCAGPDSEQAAPGAVARQKWEMLQGLPEVLEDYVTVCVLCLFYLFKTTTSNHFTITNKKPEDVGVSGLCFRGRNGSPKNRWDLPSHSRANCPWPLALHASHPAAPPSQMA